MDTFVRTGQRAFSITEWSNEDSSLIAGFSTKLSGASEGCFGSLNLGYHVEDKENHVRANRELLAGEISLPLSTWVGAEQTHGDRVVKVMTADKGKGAKSYDTAIKDTDGMYTFESGVLLTLAFADCVPIYFYAPNHHLVGIVHAGWKGTVKQIAATLVREWNSLGVKSEEIQAVIGPSICQSCYIVDDFVRSRIDKIVTNIGEKYYTEKEQGQYLLNLKEVNLSILQQAGLLRENIYTSSLCTSCDSSTFFSHRRDQGNTGRMLGFIGWKE
ncbi:peptidoglycan editing factor PgeF [Bacillus spongiae]|uniref:Purine nucleoside phosphorylase n=1 Tax=Bacillus spongiae TaxID=2683610 RepID=A0ABU8H9X1_9BACI